VIYSGPENIVIQGAPNSVVSGAIILAGVPSPWDTLEFGISTVGIGGGSNDVFAGANVALASTPGSFPVISRLNYGDLYPSNPAFASGSMILWGFGNGLGDGDFYSAIQFEDFGNGPVYSGWVHLNLKDTATSSPRITVVDWAYSDVVGGPISMGQVPEPATLFTVGLALTLIPLVRRSQLRLRRRTQTRV
jgi:hypothetical protein